MVAMMDSMRKPQTDEVARGPGTGESMAVRDFIQGDSRIIREPSLLFGPGIPIL